MAGAVPVASQQQGLCPADPAAASCRCECQQLSQGGHRPKHQRSPWGQKLGRAGLSNPAGQAGETGLGKGQHLLRASSKHPVQPGLAEDTVFQMLARNTPLLPQSRQLRGREPPMQTELPNTPCTQCARAGASPWGHQPPLERQQRNPGPCRAAPAPRPPPSAGSGGRGAVAGSSGDA